MCQVVGIKSDRVGGISTEQPERKVSDSGSKGGSSASTWRGEGLGRGNRKQKHPPSAQRCAWPHLFTTGKEAEMTSER